MRLILFILVFISSILLASTSASAGISTKKQDILKLIGNTEASNGKFAWVEINGEDYGWTREGENVGKYRIVMVEMSKVIVGSYLKRTNAKNPCNSTNIFSSSRRVAS